MLTEKSAPKTKEARAAWVKKYLDKLQADLVKDGIMSQEEADAVTAKAMKLYTNGMPTAKMEALKKLAGIPLSEHLSTTANFDSLTSDLKAKLKSGKMVTLKAQQVAGLNNVFDYDFS